MRVACTILLLMLTCFSTVSAVDIFVNNETGDDRLDGRAPGREDDSTGPVRSIRRGLQLASKFGRVILAPNETPYRECVTLHRGKHSGDKVTPFVIEGNGAILDGTRPIPVEFWQGHQNDVFSFQPKWLTYPLLFLNGRPAQRIPASDWEATIPKLEPLQWCFYKNRIYLRVEAGKFLNEYDLSQPIHPVGITIYQPQGIAIYDVIVQGFHLDGINAHDGVMNAKLAGITARGNGRSGIAIVGNSKVNIEHSLSGDNGAAQLFVDGQSKTILLNTVLLPESAPKIVKESPQAIVEIVDPPMQDAQPMDDAAPAN